MGSDKYKDLLIKNVLSMDKTSNNSEINIEFDLNKEIGDMTFSNEQSQAENALINDDFSKDIFEKTIDQFSTIDNDEPKIDSSIFLNQNDNDFSFDYEINENINIPNEIERNDISNDLLNKQEVSFDSNEYKSSDITVNENIFDDIDNESPFIAESSIEKTNSSDNIYPSNNEVKKMVTNIESFDAENDEEFEYIKNDFNSNDSIEEQIDVVEDFNYDDKLTDQINLSDNINELENINKIINETTDDLKNEINEQNSEKSDEIIDEFAYKELIDAEPNVSNTYVASADKVKQSIKETFLNLKEKNKVLSKEIDSFLKEIASEKELMKSKHDIILNREKRLKEIMSNDYAKKSVVFNKREWK